ncbi:hypothetical protein HYQ46_007396 [Verticillium longisporum]|nr:hypothetical protein HYQ46_007396 [Verticillium longisporum]
MRKRNSRPGQVLGVSSEKTTQPGSSAKAPPHRRLFLSQQRALSAIQRDYRFGESIVIEGGIGVWEAAKWLQTVHLGLKTLEIHADAWTNFEGGFQALAGKAKASFGSAPPFLRHDPYQESGRRMRLATRRENLEQFEKWFEDERQMWCVIVDRADDEELLFRIAAPSCASLSTLETDKDKEIGILRSLHLITSSYTYCDVELGCEVFQRGLEILPRIKAAVLRYPKASRQLVIHRESFLARLAKAFDPSSKDFDTVPLRFRHLRLVLHGQNAFKYLPEGKKARDDWASIAYNTGRCVQENQLPAGNIIKMMEEVVSIQESSLGVAHDRTLATLNTLARLLRDTGQSQRQSEVLRQIVLAREHTLTHSPSPKEILFDKQQSVDEMWILDKAFAQFERLLNAPRIFSDSPQQWVLYFRCGCGKLLSMDLREVVPGGINRLRQRLERSAANVRSRAATTGLSSSGSSGLKRAVHDSMTNDEQMFRRSREDKFWHRFVSNGDFVRFNLVPIRLRLSPRNFKTKELPPQKEIEELRYIYDPRPMEVEYYDIPLDHIPLDHLMESGQHLDDFWLTTFPTKLREPLVRRGGGVSGSIPREPCIGWGIRMNKEFVASWGTELGQFLLAILVLWLLFQYRVWTQGNSCVGAEIERLE